MERVEPGGGNAVGQRARSTAPHCAAAHGEQPIVVAWLACLIVGSLNSIANNYFFRDLLLPELDDDVTFLVALPSSTVRTRAAKSMEQNDSLELYSVGAKLTNISVLLCLAVQGRACGVHT